MSQMMTSLEFCFCFFDQHELLVQRLPVEPLKKKKLQQINA